MSSIERGAMGYQGYTSPPGWRGWIIFASIMMILAGVMNLIYGVIALVNDTWEGWDQEAAESVLVDLTTWGWAHVIVGGALLLTGFGVLSGNTLARIVGVVVAGISLITNFFFIPVQPLWSLTIVVMDVMIIWAITAHGGEMRETN